MEEKRPCCRQAVVAGLMHTAGTFLIRGGISDEERFEVRATTTVQGAAKLVYSYFKSTGADGQLLTSREPRFRHRLVYEVRVPGTPAALQTLNEMGVLTDRFSLRTGIAPWILKKPCCRSSFVRGCLMGAGYANNPQKEAHLEIITPHQDLCDDLVRMLVGMGFHPGSSFRRGTYVVYAKGRDDVAGILATAGAHAAALEVEEQAVVKEVRGRANRVANCDSANLRRTSTAASRQLEAISILENSGRLATLPVGLREMAEIRVDNPSATLTELSEAADPGLTRSAINHRLRRLVEAADKAGVENAHGRIRGGKGLRKAQ